mgnify:CR=1 FL=1
MDITRSQQLRTNFTSIRPALLLFKSSLFTVVFCFSAGRRCFKTNFFVLEKEAPAAKMYSYARAANSPPIIGPTQYTCEIERQTHMNRDKEDYQFHMFYKQKTLNFVYIK